MISKKLNIHTCIYEWPEGAKWELGFALISTGKMRLFWVTGNGNHKQKNNKTGNRILKIGENNRLGNGILAKFELVKWD